MSATTPPDAIQPHALAALAKSLIPAVRAAGDAVMAVYASDFAVTRKDDDSPVTEADGRAEKVLLDALASLTPDWPVVAEERVAAGEVPAIGAGPFWLVDALDGTKEFIRRNGEFTVNVGLIQEGRPILGLVLAPALDALYLGHGPGTARRVLAGADQPIACRRPPADGLVVLASRSHGGGDEMETFLARYPVASRTNAGSSLKFCRLAEGAADLYPRLAPTCEWDTAAAHAVLLAAGGRVEARDGAPLAYGKGGDFLNPHFIARGGWTDADIAGA